MEVEPGTSRPEVVDAEVDAAAAAAAAEVAAALDFCAAIADCCSCSSSEAIITFGSVITAVAFAGGGGGADDETDDGFSLVLPLFADDLFCSGGAVAPAKLAICWMTPSAFMAFFSYDLDSCLAFCISD